MSDDITNSDPNGPPPVDAKVEDAHLKGTPHHLEQRLSSLDEDTREMVQKMIADKVNSERNFKVSDEQLRKTQQRLTQLQQEKEAAEKAKMEEQGRYKELAEQEVAKRQVLEEKLFKVEVHSNLERELMSHGALDSEMASTFILSKYSDELKADPSNATKLVAALKDAKPLLFKQAVVTPQVVQPKPTGQGGSAPTPGSPSSPFNATSKKNGKFEVPMSEVERQFDEAFSKNPLF